jgi:hypothetical protein
MFGSLVIGKTVSGSKVTGKALPRRGRDGSQATERLTAAGSQDIIGRIFLYDFRLLQQ